MKQQQQLVSVLFVYKYGTNRQQLEKLAERTNQSLVQASKYRKELIPPLRVLEGKFLDKDVYILSTTCHFDEQTQDEVKLALQEQITRFKQHRTHQNCTRELCIGAPKSFIYRFDIANGDKEHAKESQTEHVLSKIIANTVQCNLPIADRNPSAMLCQ